MTMESLPDEAISNIVSYLSLWDAFALETTNQRMYRLVRAHQLVQTVVDINFPMKGLLHEKANECQVGIEKTILTRFGPKLRKIIANRTSFYTNERGRDPIFESVHFLEKLAIKCPNLIEFPSYFTEVSALFAYVSNIHSVALKKINLSEFGWELESTAADQVQGILAKCSQLEYLKLCSSDIEDMNHLLKAIEANMSQENKIRKLDLIYDLQDVLSQCDVIEKLINKLPHLEHFNLEMHEMHEADIDYLKSEKFKNLLEHVHRSKRNCVTSLELTSFENDFLTLDSTLAVHVIGMAIYDHFENETILKKFTNLRRLKIYFDLFNDQPSNVLVLPQSVRELRFEDLTQSAEVNSIEECFGNQGNQLESIRFHLNNIINCDNQLSWTNQLLVSMTKNCDNLTSLSISKFVNLYGFDSAHFQTFLKTRGNQLEHLHVNEQPLSLVTMQLISAECKTLKSLACRCIIDNGLDSAQFIEIKKLLKGMSQLYEAIVEVMQYSENSEQWEVVGKCSLANHKCMLSRR